MTCDRCNHNQNVPSLNYAQESDVNGYGSNVSIHADYPTFQQVSYKGGYQQVSDSQFNALIRELGATNSRVARNERNLIKMGNDMTIMGKNDIWFGNEITKLKNSPKGQGFTKSQIEGIIESYHGDDISRLDKIHGEQEKRITEGYQHRLSLDNKIEGMYKDHENFYKTLGQLGDDNRVLGDKLVEAKNERDRIESKIGSSEGGKSECEWYDISCHIGKGSNDIKNTALMLGAVGVGALLLMRK